MLVPLQHKLATRVAILDAIPLVLIDVETEEGITGRAYVVAYLPDGVPLFRTLLAMIERRMKGLRIEPQTLFDQLRQSLTLFGHDGLTTMALSGFDMACWDALALASGLPLARVLGGRATSIAAYNSNGLGLAAPSQLIEELPRLLERGFNGVKLRLGRENPADDLAALQTVSAALPAGACLMSDFNQCLLPTEAVARCQALDPCGLAWIEEPVAYDDLETCARVANTIETPVQLGENFYGPQAMIAALRAGAADLVMPDAQRIGGVTGWLRAAAIADASGVPMSSHLLPEISAHLLAATPTAHWLEYVNWAEPILAQPLTISGGKAILTEAAGTGIAWNEDAVHRYALPD